MSLARSVFFQFSLFILKISSEKVLSSSLCLSRWVTSAFLHLGWKEKLRVLFILCISLDKYSIPMENKYGEMGSPWRNPFSTAKGFKGVPFTRIEKDTDVEKVMIQPTNFWGKPISSINARRKNQSIESYAFLRSTFIKHLGLLFLRDYALINSAAKRMFICHLSAWDKP